MWRKLGLIIRILYNIFRLSILSFFYLGKIKFSPIQGLSPNAIIRVGNKGKISMGRCVIDGHTLIRSSGGDIKIGTNIYINRNCNIVSRESIIIGNRVSIGPNVCIYDHDHAFGKEKSLVFKTSPIIIGDDVWIGANAVILRGTIIGDNCVIGAGTVVKGKIEENTMITQEIKLKKSAING